MNFNKRAQSSKAPLYILGGLLIIAILIGTISYFNNNRTQTLNVNFNVEPSQPMGEVLGESSFNWLSYFVGRVPEWLISSTNNISAAIIIIAIWLILLLTFGDIVSAFGTFSNEYIGWGIGTLLAIVAANLKAVMLIATWSFAITAGLGVISVFAALCIPFVIFLLIQFGSSKIANFSRRRKVLYAHAKGVENITQGAQTLGAVGRTTREEGNR